MKRLLLLACIIAAIPSHCHAQDPAALRLEVAIPHVRGVVPTLHWSGDEHPAGPLIHIVLRNISKTPQSVWEKAFPVIEITDASGRKWEALSQYALNDGLGGNYVGNSKNLPPGGTLVFDMCLRRTAGSDDAPGAVYPIHSPQPDGIHFTFTSTHAFDKDAYPHGPVTLWIRCRVNIGDTLLDDGIPARPVKCIIE